MLNWTIEPKEEEELFEIYELKYDCLITFEQFLRRFHIFSLDQISHLIGLETYLYNMYIISIEKSNYK
jgi:hypothetical protein